MSVPTDQVVAASRQWVPRLGVLGTEIDRRVRRLLQDLGRTSAATAILAQLRNSVGREPGSVPAIWEVTIADLPGRAVGDDPTPEERASHAALTLFATHQQSRPTPMHMRGPGVGEAVRRLAAGDAEAAVRRRFHAVATASSFEEACHHLRGIVTQLRTAGVPLDYGQLADDLLRLQRPGGDEVVRRRWGRQYYRLDRQSVTNHDQADAAVEDKE